MTKITLEQKASGLLLVGEEELRLPVIKSRLLQDKRPLTEWFFLPGSDIDDTLLGKTRFLNGTSFIGLVAQSDKIPKVYFSILAWRVDLEERQTVKEVTTFGLVKPPRSYEDRGQLVYDSYETPRRTLDLDLFRVERTIDPDEPLILAFPVSSDVSIIRDPRKGEALYRKNARISDWFNKISFHGLPLGDSRLFIAKKEKEAVYTLDGKRVSEFKDFYPRKILLERRPRLRLVK